MKIWAAIFAGIVLANSAAAANQAPVAITDVNVIDTARGTCIGARTVLVRDGMIAAIEKPSAAQIPSDALRLDGRGLYLTPGLTDLHVHLFNNSSKRPPNEWAFPLFVANGVTAVREMRTEPAQLATVRRWREAVAAGKLVAPHILAAGVAVRGRSVDEARTQVRTARAAGADFIKVFSDVPVAHWRAILDEAGKSRLPVCGHIPAQVSLLEAARAGQRSDEHLTQVYEACSSKEKEWLAARKNLEGEALTKLCDEQEEGVLQTFDPGISREVAASLAPLGQVQVPTMVLPAAEARGSRSAFRDDPRWPLLRADEQARWGKILESETPEQAKLAAKRGEVSRQIFAALHAAKVPILAGTDTPMPLVYPGFALHDELELFVQCGMTPAEALRAATRGPAEFLGLTKNHGSIEIGQPADLLLLEADPLARIENLRRIRAVVLSGRLLRRAELDALLARAN